MGTGPAAVATRDPRTTNTTGGPTYMVADPDPDGTDSLQVTVGLLDQVIHQLVQATLDCHLGDGMGVLCQGLDEGCGKPSTLPHAARIPFPSGKEGRGEAQWDKGWVEGN